MSTSLRITEFLSQCMLAYDPSFDLTDSTFIREVLEPMATRYGESLPTADPQAVLRARLSEEVPDIDATVFGDLFAKAAGSLFMPLAAEVRATVARRQLRNDALLTQSDLRDQRDVFMLEPAEGGYSKGVARVYYSSPRAVSFNPGQRFQVPSRDGSGTTRVFTPAAPVAFSLITVRANREIGLYYVDVPLVATIPGAEHDIEPGEMRGSTGFVGAARVDNRVRFSGGRAADTAGTFTDRLRTSVRLRAPVTDAGLEYRILSLGIRRWKAVRGGEDLMVRDRVYGPASITGIPGGMFRLPADIGEASGAGYVRLGLAFDVWVAPNTAARSTLQISNLVDTGAELLVAGDGRLSFDPAAPTDKQFTLLTQAPWFRETVGTDDLFRPPFDSLRPVRIGDWVQFEGVFEDAGNGERGVFYVEDVIEPGNELRLRPLWTFNHADFGETGASPYTFRGSRLAVYRHLDLDLDIAADDGGTAAGNLFPIVCVPVTDVRAVDANGDEVTVSGYPAMAKPGSQSPEVWQSSAVPRTQNAVLDESTLPVLHPERIELADAVTQQPTGVYGYHRQFLYAEFLDSTSGAADERATRVRIHLLGPQAAALPGTCSVSSADEATSLLPLHWRFVNAEATGDGAETDVIVLAGGGSLTAGLLSPGGTDLARLPAVGDWAHFIPNDGSAPTFLPIIAIDTAAPSITVASADVVASVTGTLFIYQGTSREQQLLDGRGPEGTYSFDVWCREVTTGTNPVVYGLQAHVDATRYLCQGYDYVSPLPGHALSVNERASLALFSGYLGDGEEIVNRGVLVHYQNPDDVVRVHAMLTAREDRPMLLSGAARLMTPIYVVLAMYYDASTLGADEAAVAASSAFETSVLEQGRVEISDLVSALYSAGADYVVTGRVFTLSMDHVRGWTATATRGATPATDVGRFLLQSLFMVRLNRRRTGEVLDERDPGNWRETHTWRSGGYDAD